MATKHGQDAIDAHEASRLKFKTRMKTIGIVIAVVIVLALLIYN
jgi:hypothetical protein